jgi:UDP-N-acetylmuramoyl-tripeptide--D-alanyl-D-alanine ligase
MTLPTALQELKTVLGGQLAFSPIGFGETDASLLRPPPISIDTRTLVPGEIFWAIPGPRFDGNRFAETALRRGAAGAVVSRLPEKIPRGWVLRVPDTHAALSRWAAHRRDAFSGKIVAVTGSVGKTTTREMVHTLLRSRFAGTASLKNWNNAIGLPLSLARLRSEDDYAVVELGISAPGEMEPLACLAKPHLAVLTTMTEAHLSGLASRRKIIAEKTRLLNYLVPGGEAIVVEDRQVEQAAARKSRQVTVVGTSPRCLPPAEAIDCRPGRLEFSLEGCRFSVPVWGRHHLPSVLAAVAVGRRFGLPLEEMAAALRSFRPVAMRCELLDRGGVRILNDAYNANPASMRAALQVLGNTPTRGRRIAILGDMAELGGRTADYHFQLGRDAVRFGRVDRLIACGRLSETVLEGAKKTGLASHRGFAYYSPSTVGKTLAESIEPGDLVLIKGSRKMQMERMIEWFTPSDRSRAA